MSTNKFDVFFILGGPGAGKGTVCESLVKNAGCVHLSAGDLLRAEQKKEGSEYAEMINDCMVKGSIVPVAVTCSLILNAMNAYFKSEGKRKFLVDGFPRNEDNKTGWHSVMDDKASVKQVYVIDCPDDVCVQRCLARNVGRIDDNEETLKKRIVQFKEQGLPVIKHYEGLNLVTHVDGSKSKEDVAKSVLDSIGILV